MGTRADFYIGRGKNAARRRRADLVPSVADELITIEFDDDGEAVYMIETWPLYSMEQADPEDDPERAAMYATVEDAPNGFTMSAAAWDDVLGDLDYFEEDILDSMYNVQEAWEKEEREEIDELFRAAIHKIKQALSNIGPASREGATSLPGYRTTEDIGFDVTNFLDSLEEVAGVWNRDSIKLDDYDLQDPESVRSLLENAEAAAADVEDAAYKAQELAETVEDYLSELEEDE